jgi:phage repressor protein C with HTH and peptisase S24 domain
MPKRKRQFTIEDEDRLEFALRLRAALERSDFRSGNALATALGVSQQSVHGWLKGEAEPGRDRLVGLSNILDVSVDWLAAGISESVEEHELNLRCQRLQLTDMKASLELATDDGKVTLLRRQISRQEEVIDVLADLIQQKERMLESDKRPSIGKGPGFIGIPRYDAVLAGGHGAFNERSEILDHIPFTVDFIEKKLGRKSTAGLVVLEVRGDSMEPTISDGDLVIVDQDHRRLRDGVYAFILDDAAHVKRLRNRFDGIEIISDNDRIYSPFLLEQQRLGELQIIGRVRWCGHMFD